MKNIVSVALLMISISCFGQDAKGTIKVKKVEVDTTIYATADEMAEFPGGYQALSSFIGTNIIYPDSAINNQITGTCFISFVVNGDGKISNIKVLRGIQGCPECDQEAVRVIKMLPYFKPGTKDGAPIRVTYNIPIMFKLK